MQEVCQTKNDAFEGGTTCFAAKLVISISLSLVRLDLACDRYVLWHLIKLFCFNFVTGPYAKMFTVTCVECRFYFLLRRYSGLLMVSSDFLFKTV